MLKGVTLKADIYQIGLIIYEINTYLPAFMGDDLQTIYYHIRNNKIILNLPQIKNDKNLLIYYLKFLLNMKN